MAIQLPVVWQFILPVSVISIIGGYAVSHPHYGVDPVLGPNQATHFRVGNCREIQPDTAPIIPAMLF